jgi:hypothetical protein
MKSVSFRISGARLLIHINIWESVLEDKLETYIALTSAIEEGLVLLQTVLDTVLTQI